MSAMWRRLRFLLFRRRFDRELDEEMRFHLEMRSQREAEAGADAEEARRRARRGFGNLTLLQEISRDMWRWNTLDTLSHDLRYALRAMRRNPAFTTLALLAMALGIGANTAIFSVVNAVMLRPLPYAQPDRLVRVSAVLAKPPATGMPARVRDPGLPYAVLAGEGSPFAGVAIDNVAPYALTGIDPPQEVLGFSVSPSLFPVLGVSPLRGRTFSEGESDGVVVVSHDFWQRRWGGDESLLGRNLILNDRPYTVIGIMPRGFHYPPYQITESLRTELWTPTPISAAQATDPMFRVGSAVARLRPGISIEQAEAQATALIARLNTVMPGAVGPTRARVIPLRDGDALLNVKPALLTLFVAVGLVLLVGCANVANLQLARASARQKEMAVRVAIGAGSARLSRQLLTESLLLSIVAGIAGLLLTAWIGHLLAALIPATIPRREEVGIDPAVFAFTAVISVVTGMLTGLIPAWRAARTDPIRGIRQGPAASHRGGGVRNVFVIAELAFSLVLLIGAGLLINSFLRLVQVSPGFRTDHVLTASVKLIHGFGPVNPASRYGQASRVRAFYRSLLDRAAQIPGVQQAGAISGLPVASGSYEQVMPFQFQGQTSPSGQAFYATISPGALDVLGIPILSGRDVSSQDREESEAVVIVSRALAQRYPGDPIGKRINCGPLGWRTIIAVAGDVRMRLDREPPLWMYANFAQLPERYTVMFGRYLTLVMRSSSDPLELAPAVLGAIQELDHDLPISAVRSMDQWVSNAVAPRRFYMIALGIFAFAALAMAAAGVYGVVAYTVQRRTAEIGLRIALGAQRRDVLGLVLRQSMVVILAGVVAGALGATAFTRSLTNQLYGVRAMDPPTFVAASLVLIFISFIASYFPARRASRVDPAVTLRSE